jgi:hypothetical protein
MKKPKQVKAYRIRDMATGLFDSGYGELYRINWSKKAKVWKHLGHVKSHLNFCSEPIKPTWEVIENEVIEVEVSRFSAVALVKKK